MIYILPFLFYYFHENHTCKVPTSHRLSRFCHQTRKNLPLWSLKVWSDTSNPILHLYSHEVLAAIITKSIQIGVNLLWSNGKRSNEPNGMALAWSRLQAHKLDINKLVKSHHCWKGPAFELQGHLRKSKLPIQRRWWISPRRMSRQVGNLECDIMASDSSWLIAVANKNLRVGLVRTENGFKADKKSGVTNQKQPFDCYKISVFLASPSMTKRMSCSFLFLGSVSKVLDLGLHFGAIRCLKYLG